VTLKIPRKSTCPCGSGKKYKKCCGDPVKEKSQPPDFFETTAGRHILERAVEMMNPPKPPRMVSRPQIQTVAFGQKLRAVRNTVHYRPLKETFYDFQMNLLFWALGSDWYAEQTLKPPSKTHVILKWRDERNEVLKKHRKPSAAPDEPVRAPLTKTDDSTAVVMAVVTRRLRHCQGRLITPVMRSLQSRTLPACDTEPRN
jgi:hypothetical protein